MYVFDTSSFREIFHFYPQRFPTLWKKFDVLLVEEKIFSVKEVFREMSDLGENHPYMKWAKSHKGIFREPNAEEAIFITEIFKIEHFQQSLEKRKLLKGGNFADPFVIASAKVNCATVVTQEVKKLNAAKIPNICERFSIDCTNLEGFMERENWEF